MKNVFVLILALVLTVGLFSAASSVNASYVKPAVQTADGGSCCPSMDSAEAKAVDSGCHDSMESAAKSGDCGDKSASMDAGHCDSEADAQTISTKSESECPAIKACPSTETGTHEAAKTI